MNTIKYIGVFFDKSTIKKYAEQQNPERLYRTIEHPHVTFEYRPKRVPYELFGTPVTIRVVGYGCDGDNEAYEVVFESISEELCALAQQIKRPHITISVSQNGEPVNSNNLKFVPVPPFCLTGVFGGKAEDGDVYIQNCEI